MRSYLIDELSPRDVEKVNRYLTQKALASGLEKIFWVPVPNHLLSHIQSRHRTCQPFVYALELGGKWVKIECFVRSLKGMICECQDYPTPGQMTFILDFAHQMIKDLGIKT